MARPPKSIVPPSLSSAIRGFLKMEAASGVFMCTAAAFALLAANSSLRDIYTGFVHAPLYFGSAESVNGFVKDWLMVLFFLLVGLELKHEMAHGFLKKKSQVLLPMIAAVSGMVVPALLFLAINLSNPENWAGWAIASATDIAFALCVLLLLGRGLPPALKIFLLAVAIFDDVGAILVIAFFYSEALNPLALFMAVVGIGILYFLNRLQVVRLWSYVVVGFYLCVCLLYSGIHTTMGGVILGLMMPIRGVRSGDSSPVEICIKKLHPWVGFFILPLFAFTAAGIHFGGMTFDVLLSPLTFGIILALFLGKQLGVFGAVYFAVRAGWARLPERVSWLDVYGVSVIAGIGFTISLFIGALAFSEGMQNQVKLGVLCGSLLSAAWGGAVLAYSRKINSR